jgi:molecular chaperone DnaJ
LRGEGEIATGGGRQGDLYVSVQVQPHDVYWRQGQDVHADLELNIVQAALGSRVEVETLEGPQEVVVDRGVQTGDTINIKRLGVPNVRSGKRGDLILHIFVKTPEKLSRKQTKLLEEFAAESKEAGPKLRKKRTYGSNR